MNQPLNKTPRFRLKNVSPPPLGMNPVAMFSKTSIRKNDIFNFPNFYSSPLPPFPPAPNFPRKLKRVLGK